jgi:small nuclear ribonucleoprotein E
VLVWLYENTSIRIQGTIIGFDEYMNLVLDDAEEINQKTKQSTKLGRILLKGDNISVLQNASGKE